MTNSDTGFRRLCPCPPGQRHTFWNPADEPAEYLTLISPPGFEQCLLQPALGLESVRSDEEAATLRARLGDSFDVTVLGPPRRPGITVASASGLEPAL